MTKYKAFIGGFVSNQFPDLRVSLRLRCHTTFLCALSGQRVADGVGKHFCSEVRTRVAKVSNESDVEEEEKEKEEENEEEGGNSV